jgi:protease II
MGAAFASASAQEHTGGLTIEQIASAPFPSQLRAAPSGESVAWVYNEQGARNVWVAELRGTSYAARRLTVYRDDDGNDINDLVWGADAKTLFYTRGGDNGEPQRSIP